MLTIKENIENSTEIKKSKFITHIYKVETVEEIENILKKEREKYKDATHICYAYRLTTFEKANDDNEPAGTAGIPILEVLKKQNLINCLAVVIRYFGGIKLGAGGLVRAYSQSITECLKLCNIRELTKGYLINIYTDYNRIKELDYILRDMNIINKVYDEKIKYEVKIKQEDLNKISNYHYEIIKEINIES